MGWKSSQFPSTACTGRSVPFSVRVAAKFPLRSGLLKAMAISELVETLSVPLSGSLKSTSKFV